MLANHVSGYVPLTCIFFSRDEGGRLTRGPGSWYSHGQISLEPREDYDPLPPGRDLEVRGGVSWYSCGGGGGGRGIPVVLGGGSSARGNTTTPAPSFSRPPFVSVDFCV